MILTNLIFESFSSSFTRSFLALQYIHKRMKDEINNIYEISKSVCDNVKVKYDISSIKAYINRIKISVFLLYLRKPYLSIT